ncbi:MAG: hypothetical protein M1825_000787 [Sarcosagium campestre]|nr:MAG: hypothetical protein M1825_000787 [Sarcosagium campestre]
MTSISQPPSNPSHAQVHANATTNSSNAPNSTSSNPGSGASSTLAAASAPAVARSYANATKKTVATPAASVSTGPSPPVAAGGNPAGTHAKSSSVSPVNGRVPIPAAVPTVGGTTAVNTNNGVNGAPVHGEHSRKPSVTISAAGASGQMPNGGPVAGPPSRTNSIQFGSMGAGASPVSTYSTPHPHGHAHPQHHPSASLPVATPSNPRITSPQASPSPIPQPAASGGRPPSAIQGPANSMSFGSLGAETGDGSRQVRPLSLHQAQGPLAPGPQATHLRRESSQSTHSDMSNPSMGPGRGGFPPQGGRGRGFNQQYSQHQQMAYPPPSNFRGTPVQHRGGPNMGPQFQGQSGGLRYPDSPHRSNRSPAVTNSQPGTPQMHQVPMANPQIQSAHYGGYPGMGHPQVNTNPSTTTTSTTTAAATAAATIPPSHFSSSSSSSSHKRQDQINQSSRRGQSQHHVPAHNLTPLPIPNLAPEHGLMEQFLIAKNLQAHYAMSAQYDPNYAQYPPQYGMYGNMYVPGQPSSPRPPYQQLAPGAQQHYIPGQYGQAQPQPMSRTSSSVSEQRPGSSVGQPTPPSITPAVGHAHHPSQGKNSPTPNPGFTKPPRKSAAITIKDPTSGAIKSFDHVPASPSPGPTLKSSSPATVTASTPTPPRSTEPQHARSDSKNARSDEAKKNEMKDAIAKKIEADKAEEKRRKETGAQKSIQAREAEQKKADDEAAAAAAATAKAQKAAEEEAQREKDEAAAKVLADEKARKADEERVAAAEKEAESKRLQEEAAESKRVADEAEAQRTKRSLELEAAEKTKAASTSEDAKDVSPAGLAAGVAKLSLASGASTPASDDSAAPPTKSVSLGKSNKPAALNLAPLKTGSVEPPQPSAALQALRSARFIDRLSDVTYPNTVASPNPALNTTAPKGRFKYEKDFLLQFQVVFTEKPSVDWDAKLKDTVGDTSDSARPQSARTPSMGARNTSRPGVQSFPMGSFGQAGRTLPPGTTSEQRMAISSGAQPRPPMQNPLAQFSRPGGFPMGGQPMSLSNSATSLQSHSGTPNSPRSNNRSQRNNSKRTATSDKPHQSEEKAMKTMPLTANADVKPLALSTGGWKPRSIGTSSSATGVAGPAPGAPSTHLEPEMVQRKVKSNLNKMTPEKFEKIADQILDIAGQSRDESDGRTLRQVIQLTFEKATDEAHWASMYAKFCKRMLESMSAEIKDEGIKDKNGNVVTGGNLFRKYLLNRCQEEFERGWKLNLPPKPEGETEVMLSDDYYIAAAAKRRGLGLVQFIGELYKLGMLTERIMHECVKKLVDYDGIPDEAEVESLTKLLRTIGWNLDNTEKGKPLMEAYFLRIQAMIDTPDLPSRLQFMLMDIVDLRRKGWASKEQNKGPQTIQEIREEAQRQQAEKDAERARQQSQRGGGGRLPMGRGDARSFSGGGQYGSMPPPDTQRNTVGMDDLRRLGSKAGSRQASQGPVSFGPTSMFNSRSSSGRKTLGPTGLSRGGEDSGASSRTGTPPAAKEKEQTSANAFGPLASLESAEGAEATSPPSAGNSPPTTKAKLGGPSDFRPRSPTKRGGEPEKVGGEGASKS